MPVKPDDSDRRSPWLRFLEATEECLTVALKSWPAQDYDFAMVDQNYDDDLIAVEMKFSSFDQEIFRRLQQSLLQHGPPGWGIHVRFLTKTFESPGPSFIVTPTLKYHSIPLEKWHDEYRDLLT